MVVVKRDGRKAMFDASKIEGAVLKAFMEVDGEITPYAKSKAKEIAAHIAGYEDDELEVEVIQDVVENKLMASNRKDVARAYVIYRNDRNRARERNSEMTKEIGRRLDASDVDNQNANVDERSFGGRIGSVASTVMKEYALNHCMSEMARMNHLSNQVYIHDLDHYAVGDHNCLSVPFDDLLANGFNTRQTDVRPAQSVSTAFQLVAVIFQLQSLQQFGGVSATHIDWTMVPYVRKSFFKHYRDGVKYICGCKIGDEFNDETPINASVYMNSYPSVYSYAMDMTEKEVRQAVEAMYHNLKIWATQQ